MYEAQIARRAELLLNRNAGVTYRYALAAIEAGLVDEEDLRGCGRGKAKRYFLA